MGSSLGGSGLSGWRLKMEWVVMGGEWYVFTCLEKQSVQRCKFRVMDKCLAWSSEGLQNPGARRWSKVYQGFSCDRWF